MSPRDGGTQDEELGALERSGALSVLRYRRRLAHAQEEVWRAITEDAHLAAWFPTTIEGARLAGAPLHFAFRESEGAPFGGEMLAFVPPSLMELRWADDVLRFELEADGPGCILRLTVSFPERGKAARDAAGWHVCLDQLVVACDGADLVWRPPDRWRVVHAVDVDRLGPEASAIGPPEEWKRVHGAEVVQGDKRLPPA